MFWTDHRAKYTKAKDDYVILSSLDHSQCNYGLLSTQKLKLRFLSNRACTHIVIMGATESKLAIRIPISEIQAVRTKARVGSPELEP